MKSLNESILKSFKKSFLMEQQYQEIIERFEKDLKYYGIEFKNNNGVFDVMKSIKSIHFYFHSLMVHRTIWLKHIASTCWSFYDIASYFFIIISYLLAKPTNPYDVNYFYSGVST